MATRLKNVDEIVSANNSKTTVLDYTPVTVTPDGSGVATVNLSAGNNFTVAGATTLSFSNMSGQEGQSGNIYVTGGCGIDTNMIKAPSSASIDSDHWVSYFVISSTHVVISVSEAVA